MKSKLTLLYVFLAALLAGCYEDKGNYSYADLPQYVVDENSIMGYSRIVMTQGDTLTLEPVVTNAQGDTLGDIPNVEYTWTLNYEKVISRERNLVYVCDELIDNGELVFDIHDLTTDLHFMGDVTLEVGEKYATGGYYVLSVKDGHTSLGLVRGTWIGNSDIPREDNGIYTQTGLYYAENGEYLPDDPIRIHEHSWNGGGSQAMVVTPTELVDITSGTLLKDITGSEMMDGGWPAGLRVANVMYMGWVDLLEDEQGHIYTRIKQTDQLPNSEYFYLEPVGCDGESEPLTDTHIIVSKIAGSFCLLNDARHKRILHMSDVKSDAMGEYSVGRITPLRHFNWPQGFVPLDDYTGYNLVHCGYFDQYQYGGTGYSYLFIFEKDGQYTVQTCRIWQDAFHSSTLTVDEMNVLSYDAETGRHIDVLESVMRPDSYIYTLPYTTQASNPGAYTFIANGNELYMYDRTANLVKPYLSFDAPVTAMDGEYFNSNYMGLGLENGKFCLLEMKNAKNLADDEKIVWQSGPDFGRIVYVRYKGAIGWQPAY